MMSSMSIGRAIRATFVVAALLTVRAAAATPVEAANAALQTGNASNAVALLTQALADPSLSAHDRARIQISRGLAYESLGERDAALVDLTEAINAHELQPPELARAFYNRGVTLDELGRAEDAVGDYSSAIRIEPGFAAALNNRGNAYRRLNKMAEARADYLASLAAGNPHPEYPNFGLGQIAEASGQPAQAGDHYRAALAADPHFALAAERLRVMGSLAAPSAAAPPAPGVIQLRPPKGAEVHLRPPGQAAVHLRPPGSPPAARPDVGLKPAISEGGAATGQAVQLGAWRREEDATKAWNRLIGGSGSRLVAGMSPEVVPVDLPGRGRYYRLRARPVAPGAGPGLCAALKARGVACMLVRD